MSIDYKLNRLSQTWVGTAQSFADRGTLGSAIDALTTLSEAIGGLLDKIQSFPGILPTIGAGVGLFLGANNNGLIQSSKDKNGNNVFSLFGGITKANASIGEDLRGIISSRGHIIRERRKNDNAQIASEYQSFLMDYIRQFSTNANVSMESVARDNALVLSDAMKNITQQYRDNITQEYKQAQQTHMYQSGEVGDSWLDENLKDLTGDAVGALAEQLEATAGASSLASRALDAFKGVVSSLALGAATALIQFMVKSLIDLAHESENAKQASKELVDTYKAETKTINENWKQLEGQGKRFDELSKGVSGLGTNIGLTNSEFEEYHEIANQIADQFPELVKGYDDEGNAILKASTNADTLAESYRNLQKERAAELLSQKDTILDGVKALDELNPLETILGKQTDVQKRNAMSSLLKMSDEDLPRYITETILADLGDGENLQYSEELISLQKALGVSLEELQTMASTNPEKIRQAAQSLMNQYQATIDTQVNGARAYAESLFNYSDQYDKLDEEGRKLGSILVQGMSEGVALETKNNPIALEDYVNQIYDALSNNQVKEALQHILNEDATISELDNYWQIVISYFRHKGEELPDNLKDVMQESQAEIDRMQRYTDKVLNSTKVDHTERNKQLQKRADLLKQLRKESEGGTADLSVLPSTSNDMLTKAGYTDIGSTQTFSNVEGTIAINATPIFVNPQTGQADILSPKALQNYVEDIINQYNESGTYNDEYGIVIGSVFDGDNAKKEAEQKANELRELQQQYYTFSFTDERQGQLALKVNDISESMIPGTEEYDAWLQILRESGEEAEKGGNAATIALTKWSERAHEARDEAETLGASVSSMVNKLANFSSMQSVISDIQDGGAFDYSKLFATNSDETGFYDIFGKYEKEFNDFVQAVTLYPDDLEGSAVALEALVNRWFQSSDIISDINEQNKDTILSMLNQMNLVVDEADVDTVLKGKQLLKQKQDQMLADGYVELDSVRAEATELTREQVDEIVKVTEATEEEKDALYGLIDALDNVSVKYDEAAANAARLTESQKFATDLNKSFEGISDLEKLISIYKDVRDGEEFDFSSLANLPDSFTKSDSFIEFVNTISNHSDDIEATQAAFNKLATEILMNSKVLDGLNEETKNVIIQTLKQMGVTNAETVIEDILAKRRELLTKQTEAVAEAQQSLIEQGKHLSAATKEFTELTEEEILDLIREAEVADATRQVLMELYLTKIDINNVKLDTREDIQQMINLVQAAGGAVSALKTLDAVKRNTANIGGLDTESERSEKFAKKHIEHYGNSVDDVYDAALAEIQAIQDKIKADQSKPIELDTSIDLSSVPEDDDDKSKDKSEPQKNVFDWIERGLSKLEKTVSRFGKLVSDTWNSWIDRTGALNNEIAATVEEINAQNAAAEAYMQHANSLGLPQEYVDKIINGTMEIETIMVDDDDEATKALVDKINDFQEFYDKAEQARDAVDDLTQSLHQLYLQRFDLIEQEFTSEIGLNEALFNRRTSRYDFLKNRNWLSEGFISDYYNEYASNVRTNQALKQSQIAAMEGELARLESEHAEMIGSEAWTDLKTRIEQAKNELEEYNITLEDMPYQMINDIFDEINEEVQDRIGLNNTRQSRSTAQYEHKKERGWLTDSDIDSYYSELEATTKANQAIQQDALAKLEAELASFETQNPDKIGTAAWTALVNQIETAKNELVEYGITLENLPYEKLAAQFENIQNEVANIIAYNEARQEKKDKVYQYREANGLLNRSRITRYYNRTDERLEENIGLTIDEINRLKAALASSGIEKYSAEWYEYKTQIQEAKNQLADYRIAVIQNARDEVAALKQVREARLQNRLDRIDYNTRVATAASATTLTAMNSRLDYQNKQINRQITARAKNVAEAKLDAETVRADYATAKQTAKGTKVSKYRQTKRETRQEADQLKTEYTDKNSKTNRNLRQAAKILQNTSLLKHLSDDDDLDILLRGQGYGAYVDALNIVSEAIKNGRTIPDNIVDIIEEYEADGGVITWANAQTHKGIKYKKIFSKVQKYNKAASAKSQAYTEWQEAETQAGKAKQAYEQAKQGKSQLPEDEAERWRKKIEEADKAVEEAQADYYEYLMTSSTEWFENLAQQFQNTIDFAEQDISFLQTQMGNTGNYTGKYGKVKYIDSMLGKYDDIIDVKHNAIQTYTELENDSKQKIVNVDSKTLIGARGKKFGELKKKDKKAVKKLVKRILKCVEKGKPISEQDLQDLTKYASQDYIDGDFVIAVRDYINAPDYKAQAEAALKIEEENVRSQQATLTSQKFETLREKYEKKRQTNAFRTATGTATSAYTSSTKIDQLEFEEAQEQTDVNTYINNAAAGIAKTESIGEKASSLLTKANEGKGTKKYKTALQNALNAIQKGEPVKEADLQAIKNYADAHPTTTAGRRASRLYTLLGGQWNTSLDENETDQENLINAIIAAAQNHFDRINQHYDALTLDSDNRTSLLEAKDKNSKSTSERNGYLDEMIEELGTRRDIGSQRVGDLLVEEGKYANQIINALDNKNTRVYGKMYESRPAEVDTALEKVRDAYKAKEAISSDVMADLATYVKKQWILESFFQACQYYNQAVEARKEGQYTQSLLEEATKTQESQIALEKIQNTTTGFDRQIDRTQYRIDMLGSRADLETAKGHTLSRNFLEAQRDAALEEEAQKKQKAIQAQEELNQAIAEGRIEVGSDDWWTAVQQIEQYNIEAAQAAVTTQEWSNSIRKLDFDKFTRLREKIQDVSSEAEWLADVITNENWTLYDEDTGKLNDAGQAVLGLHSMSMKNYWEEYQSYLEEIERYNQMIEDDATQNGGEYNQDMIDERDTLIQQSREMYSAWQNEAMAMKQLYEEQYSRMINAMQELIDKRKEALRAEKDLYDYQKNIKSQTDNIGSLEKQVSAYEGDTSEEGRARLQRLQVELEEARTELAETEWEQQIAEEEKMLDTLLEEYETFLDGVLNENLSILAKTLMDNADANAAATAGYLDKLTTDTGLKVPDDINTYYRTAGLDIRVIRDIVAQRNDTEVNPPTDVKDVGDASGGSSTNNSSGSTNPTSSPDDTTSSGASVPSSTSSGSSSATDSGGNVDASSMTREEAETQAYKLKQAGHTAQADMNALSTNMDSAKTKYENVSNAEEEMNAAGKDYKSQLKPYAKIIGRYTKGKTAAQVLKEIRDLEPIQIQEKLLGYLTAAKQNLEEKQKKAKSKKAKAKYDPKITELKNAIEDLSAAYVPYSQKRNAWMVVRTNKYGYNLADDVTTDDLYQAYLGIKGNYDQKVEEWEALLREYNELANIWGFPQLSDFFSGFSQGGLVTKDDLLDSKNIKGFASGGLINRSVIPKGDHTLIGARVGEFVLTEDMLKDAVQVVEPLSQMVSAGISAPLGATTALSTNSTSIDDVNVTITLPNVQNYQQFMTEFQKDKNAQKLIQVMVGNAMTGKNSMSKFNTTFK